MCDALMVAEIVMLAEHHEQCIQIRKHSPSDECDSRNGDIIVQCPQKSGTTNQSVMNNIQQPPSLLFLVNRSQV